MFHVKHHDWVAISRLIIIWRVYGMGCFLLEKQKAFHVKQRETPIRLRMFEFIVRECCSLP